MQKRHTDRQLYFDELATTSRRYFLPYLEAYATLDRSLRVLELGCGDGGNLCPFAELGCRVVGIDLCAERIETAKRNFEQRGLEADFRVADICTLPTDELGRFDVIVCHDVIEHIDQKAVVLDNMARFLADNGVVFMGFPAWQMPFGGHQQICRNRFLSHCPWLHLLPKGMYAGLLKWGGESEACIHELLSIKRTKTPIEAFEKLVAAQPALKVVKRTLYLINPHYHAKFGLHPVRLPRWLAVPYLRNFVSTTCFYLLVRK